LGYQSVSLTRVWSVHEQVPTRIFAPCTPATARRATGRVAAERAGAERLDAQLREAHEALGQAEDARGLAVEQAEEAQRGADAAEGKLAATRALWDLERTRLEREWAEVTGTPAPLPEPWDGGVRAAVAVELEIIREVMGVPSSLEVAGAWVELDPLDAMAAFRLIAEVLRSLARVGDELAVSFGAGGLVSITLATHDGAPRPDLTRPTAIAASFGAELRLVPTPDGFQARLRWPPRR
jgi:hypothetical protein